MISQVTTDETNVFDCIFRDLMIYLSFGRYTPTSLGSRELLQRLATE